MICNGYLSIVYPSDFLFVIIAYLLFSLELDMVTRVQILRKAVCISDSANTIRKVRIQRFSPHFFDFGMATGFSEKENWMKTKKPEKNMGSFWPSLLYKWRPHN